MHRNNVWQMDRRTVLKLVGGAALGSMAAWESALAAQGNGKHHTYKCFNQTSGPRPKYVWENMEDVIYHTLAIDDKAVQSTPELCCFMEQVYTFNKQMRWVRQNGCIVCYEDGAELRLTGDKEASHWISDAQNLIEVSGDFTLFTKRSTIRRRDCAVLPFFQFNIRQHPIVELEVAEASDDWQFCISIKGRGGIPLMSSDWQRGPRRIQFNVADELKRRGYTLNYAELHFVMGMWAKDSKSKSSVKYRIGLVSQPALVTCLPIIRTAETAAEGIGIASVVVDENGAKVAGSDVKVYAVVNCEKIALTETDGVWQGNIKGLKQGSFDIPVISEGRFNLGSTVNIRVTKGAFWTYNKRYHSVEKEGAIVGPVTGSYQGSFFFKDMGLASERMINGQTEWDQWDRKKTPGERLHGWESLTEKELDERFSYLEKCGWDLLHLHQHWGIWERYDAGGAIAPHGAEQLALYLKTASRHNLRLIQALTSYEYAMENQKGWIGGTKPWRSYVDAGFKTEDWFNPKNQPFNDIFHNYLADFLTLFEQDDILVAMTASGEGDHENGLPRSLDIFNFVRERDKRHLFLAEPIMLWQKLPKDELEGWVQDLCGTRTYCHGETIDSDLDISIACHLNAISGTYQAEGSWPSSNAHTHFLYDKNNSQYNAWAGREIYRTQVRDSVYMGLLHRTPLIVTWDEAITEDERLIFRRLRDSVNWAQDWQQASVGIRIGANNVQMGKDHKDRAILGEYDRYFRSLPLSYTYVQGDEVPAAQIKVVLDARKSFTKPVFQSAGGTIPDELKKDVPLGISKGYAAQYLWSSDRKTLLAYIYNITGHVTEFVEINVQYHRVPKPAAMEVVMRNLPEGLRLRLFDLNAKTLATEDEAVNEKPLTVRHSRSDFFLLVSA